MDKDELRETIKSIQEEQKLLKINKWFKDPKKASNICGWLAVALVYASLIAVASIFISQAQIESLIVEKQDLQADSDQAWQYYEKEVKNTKNILSVLNCDDLKKVYALNGDYDQTIQKLLIINSCN